MRREWILSTWLDPITQNINEELVNGKRIGNKRHRKSIYYSILVVGRSSIRQRLPVPLVTILDHNLDKSWIIHFNIQHHHHHAISRDATKTASITWVYCSLFISLLWEWCPWVGLKCLSASGFSWWFLWTGDEGALSFYDQKTVESRESALVACLVTFSWGIQSTGDSFPWPKII